MIIARATTRKKAEALLPRYATPERPLEVTYWATGDQWATKYPWALHDAGEVRAPSAGTETTSSPKA